MKEEIKKLKKISLHLHLDGSLSCRMASQLSGLKISEVKEKMEAPSKCLNLANYLEKFAFPLSLMQTKKNLKLIAKDLATRLVNDNVIYAEIRFAPILHQERCLTLEEVVDAVLSGLKEVKGLKTNLILCLMRGASYEKNLETLELAYKYLGKGVGGIDLAGDEQQYRLKEYKELFKIAKDKKIPFTIHVGEVNSKDIVEAIRLGAKRFGHGVKCIDDKRLIELIRDNNILLEICPTSNIQTNAFKEYSNHPIYKLYKDKVNITIDVDNMTTSKINLSKEYLKLCETFKFTIMDLKKININSINYTFLSSKEKIELLEEMLK